MTEFRQDPGSFRDPNGHVFWLDGLPYRSVTASGKDDMELLQQSGLADELCADGRLVPFSVDGAMPDGAMRLKLSPLPWISYPYEWCFEQLQDAATLTLDVMLAALARDMMLKDASAFNVAWRGGRPIFLDHGSFTRYINDRPWPAYRQFCEHFLAPLAVISRNDALLGMISRCFLDGIPLDLASQLLPWTSWLRPSMLMHIHLHAKMQRRFADSARKKSGKSVTMPKNSLLAMLENLRGAVRSLRSPVPQSAWHDYYHDTNYNEKAFADKHRLVAQACGELAPTARVIDLGANNGEFSRIAAQHAALVVAADMDHGAVAGLYRSIRGQADSRIYPLVQNLDNPTPGLGLFNSERRSFLERCRGDLAMGLALIHHLRIGSNWPLAHITRLFAQCADTAIVEFVPKDDGQVQRLLHSRPDIYPDWTLEQVCQAFAQSFSKCQVENIAESKRSIIFLKK
ncbi:MAG: SAM-dependent methyltransferase [Lentisphaeria bacterium]|jgi:hypothetical protein